MSEEKIFQGTPGINEGGVGYTLYYTGISGSVPVGADPVDGETMAGKTSEIVYIEITHEIDA